MTASTISSTDSPNPQNERDTVFENHAGVLDYDPGNNTNLLWAVTLKAQLAYELTAQLAKQYYPLAWSLLLCSVFCLTHPIVSSVTASS